MVSIWQFDDGLQEFKNYTNKWVVINYKFSGAKLVLQNFYNENIKISSISEWKTRPYMQSE